MFGKTCATLAAMVLIAMLGSLLAAGEPVPTDLLFKLRQLDLVEKGAEVIYKFERKASDEVRLGLSFADDIRVGVTKVGDKGEREVTLNIFSGDRAHDKQNYPDLTINPIFLWYLDRTVASFSQLTGASPPYLKGKFRSMFDEKGKVEAIKADFGGNSVNAYRITVTPYAGDPSAAKMRGYDQSSFAFVVSDAVPGYFLGMNAVYESKNKDTPRLEEHLAIVGKGESK